MGSNSITQGIVVDFKGNLAPFKSASKDFKSDISSMKTIVKDAGSAMDSAFKGSANSLKSLSSSIKSAGSEATKLSSLQVKAAEAAKRLELAEASAALALKRAMDMEQGGKASAEQLAVAQSKAALAAQQVETRQNQLASAAQKVANEEKSLAEAMAQDARESMSFSEALARVKGVLGSVGTGIKVAIEGMSSLASVMGGAAKGAIGSVTSGVKGAVIGLIEFGAKALSAGGQAFSGIEKATSSVMHFKSESSSMHVSFMSGIKSMIGGLLDFTSKIGMAVYGIRSMIDASVGLGKALLSPAADAEQTATAFTGLLGSAQKATAFLKDLRKFAATTPFEFPELAAASRKMLSFGFATRDVIPMMTRLGDAVATMGGGSEEIDRAVTAIGQMHAKTKITADEMNQLTELGIPAWDMLAKSMGKTTAQVMDLSSKGLIPADKGIEALLKGMERFKGGMDAQSKTFKGMLSNLKDGVTMALMAFGGPILESAKSGLGELIKLVSSPAFERFATVTGKGIASVIDNIGKSASKVKNELKAFVSNLDLSPLTNGISKAENSIKKFAKSIDPLPVQLFLSSIKYLGSQLDRTFGIIKGTGIFLFHQLTNMIDVATGKTTKFHKSFDIVNGVLTKTRGPLQTLIGEGFFKLGSVIASAAEHVHRFGDYLNHLNWMPVILGAKSFAEGVGKKSAEILKTIGKVIDDKVKPAFEGVANAMHLPIFQKMGDVLGHLGQAALDLGGSIFSLWETFSPIGAIFKEISGSGLSFSGVLSSVGDIIDNYVTPAIKGLNRFIEDMGPLLAPISAQLLGMFSGFGDWLKQNGPTMMDLGGKIFTVIGGAIELLLPIVSNDLLPALSTIGGIVGTLSTDFLTWADSSSGLQANLTDLWTWISENVSPIFTSLGNIIKNDVMPHWDNMKKSTEHLTESLGKLWDKISPILLPALASLGLSGVDTKGKMDGMKTSIDVVGVAIDAFITGLNSGIDALTTLVDWLSTAIGWMNNFDASIVNASADLLNFVSLGNAHAQHINPNGQTTGGGASGAFAGGVENFKGGMAVVGEKGPELVRLPRGSDVFTANETKSMLKGMNKGMPAQSNFAQPSFKYPSAPSSAGGQAPVINVYVTVQPTDVRFDIDGYELANRVGPHIAREMVVQR